MARYTLQQDAWPGRPAERVRPGRFKALRIGGILLLVLTIGVTGQALLRAPSIRNAIPVIGVVLCAVTLLGFLRVRRIWWRTFEIELDGNRLVQRAAFAKPLSWRVATSYAWSKRLAGGWSWKHKASDG